MNVPLFFIFGTKRGGTTLLRLMLNANPLIHIPNESHFLIPVLQRFSPKSPLSKSEQYELIQIIEKGGRFDTWNTTTSQLQDIVRNCSEFICLSDIIGLIYQHESKEINPDIIGEKTPEYTDCIHEIRNLFPESKFIFIIRDARDVSNSLQARGWEGWSHYQRGLYWNSVVKKLLSLENDKRNFLLRYEDLVLDQEKSMQQLSTFLGVNYSQKMLSFNDNYMNQLTQVEIEMNIHKSISDIPSNIHISRWKKNGANEDFYYLEKVCYKNLQKLDYELSYSLNELEAPSFIRKLQLLKYSVLIMIYDIYHEKFSRCFSRSVKASAFFQMIRAYIRAK